MIEFTLANRLHNRLHIWRKWVHPTTIVLAGGGSEHRTECSVHKRKGNKSNQPHNRYLYRTKTFDREKINMIISVRERLELSFSRGQTKTHLK